MTRSEQTKQIEANAVKLESIADAMAQQAPQIAVHALDLAIQARTTLISMGGE